MAKRFLIVPDSFKGTLSSEAAAQAMREGVLRVFPDAEIESFAMADGGEGSSAIAGRSVEAERVEITATGPEGFPVQSFYYRSGTTALIELAAASGFVLSKNPMLTAATATTYGTGELIRHAVQHGCKEITLFLGGSATTDGGVGMARAIGVRFFGVGRSDLNYGVLPDGTFPGEQLAKIHAYRRAEAKLLLAQCTIRAVVDVDNPLCGEMGAPAVYGPQKGLTPEQVRQLDQDLETLAHVAEEHTSFDYSAIPGSGAAGGTGFGVVAFLGGSLTSGSTFFLELVGFQRRIKNCDYVITGEGQADSQSLQGKLLGKILEITAAVPVKVISICGRNALSPEQIAAFPQLRVAALDPAQGMLTPGEAVRDAAADAIRRFL